MDSRQLPASNHSSGGNGYADEDALKQPLELGVSNDCTTTTTTTNAPLWEPSGNWWKDFLFFCGPGWFVSIAYVDPGNYQADIQAGATTRYYLLFALWWTSILSIYVQILCVRLAYYAQLTLAETQARDAKSRMGRYGSWFVAELSVVITDLPTVIGIGIALHQFFGWPYYVGVLLSLLTTMLFLATMKYGMQVLEVIVFFFVGIMSLALWMEMAFVSPNGSELVKGWVYGFAEVQSEDVFSIAGILGSVVMPHNLYLHTAAVQLRKVKQSEPIVRQAVKYCSIEPVIPIVISFFVNMAVVTIAAESVYGTEDAESVGLTDFCNYFQSLKGGCLFWGVALLAAGQSSAITTTYTGQYVMDGFLNLQLPMGVRAIVTRLVAITPCIIVSVLFPDRLNDMINVVNASLSFLLPFAFTPLVKYNCSERVMGKYASKGKEKVVLYTFAILVWAINAAALSWKGGGFFGFVFDMAWSGEKFFYILLQIAVQVFYAWWNFATLFSPVNLLPRAILAEEEPQEQQQLGPSE
jgi:natural resistance-associated macrophage protein